MALHRYQKTGTNYYKPKHSYGNSRVIPKMDAYYWQEDLMAEKAQHFMDEDDIGSGEKTAAQQDDLEQLSHLREQQEQMQQPSHPQDGSQLHHVVEEQQFLLQRESHLPLPGAQQSPPAQPDKEQPAVPPGHFAEGHPGTDKSAPAQQR